MRNILISLLLVISFTSSGCALLLVGAAAGLTVSIVKKVSSNPRSLTKEERMKTEYRDIEGSKQEVLYAAREALVSMGYTIEELNINKKKKTKKDNGPTTNVTFGDEDKKEEGPVEDLVTGVMEKPLLRITAVVEKVGTDRVGLRLIAENENGLVENKRLYEVLFDEIINKINETRKSEDL